MIAVAMLAASCSGGDDPSGGGTPGTDGSTSSASEGACTLFPADSYWHADVSGLPVHGQSNAILGRIGADVGVHPDFGTVYEGAPIGIPFVEIDASTPKVDITFSYDDESDPGPYHLPVDAPIEGGPDSDGDRHVLVWDKARCRLEEVYDAHPKSATEWEAGSGATWDLRSNVLRPEGWTSADAAGLPILPGLVRFDEVAAGEIDHALRFTVDETRDSFIWPARHRAGSGDDASFPPMGTWVRLKNDFDLSGFSAPVQVILRAMQKHGMIVADNGSSMFVTGAPDPRWDDDTLVSELKRVTVSDFEVVDSSSLIVSPDSGQVRR